MRRWATSRLPRGLLWRQWELAPGELHAFARPPYDLVWYSHIDCYVAIGGIIDGRSLVDLDTLEDFRLRYTLAHRRDADDEWHQGRREQSRLAAW